MELENKDFQDKDISILLKVIILDNLLLNLLTYYIISNSRQSHLNSIMRFKNN